jgi:hypothetical protein
MSNLFIAVFIVATSIIFGQLVIAIFSNKALQLNKYIYGKPLSHPINGAELVEKYLKIYRQIAVKVNAPITKPAVADQDTLALNKQLVYHKDLYTNLFICIALVLTTRKFWDLQNNRIYSGLFVIEAALYAYGGLSLNLILFSLAPLIGILLISSGFYRAASFSFVAKPTLEIAQDLLNLTDSETIIAQTMLISEARRFHLYPLSAITGLYDFIRP